MPVQHHCELCRLLRPDEEPNSGIRFNIDGWWVCAYCLTHYVPYLELREAGYR